MSVYLYANTYVCCLLASAHLGSPQPFYWPHNIPRLVHPAGSTLTGFLAFCSILRHFAAFLRHFAPAGAAVLPAPESSHVCPNTPLCQIIPRSGTEVVIALEVPANRTKEMRNTQMRKDETDLSLRAGDGLFYLEYPTDQRTDSWRSQQRDWVEARRNNWLSSSYPLAGTG